MESVFLKGLTYEKTGRGILSDCHVRPKYFLGTALMSDFSVGFDAGLRLFY